MELLPDGENSLVLRKQLNGAVLVGRKELGAIYPIHHCRRSNARVVLGVVSAKAKLQREKPEKVPAVEARVNARGSSLRLGP